MSRSRRPSVSIYDYPEHLNPFNDEIANSQPQIHREGKTKDSKHKFWTFGRSRKKRSNSFSIKSTWSGLFGKRKDDKLEVQEKRSTITTVSSTYKRDPYLKPAAPQRPSKDQQEFDEALGTLARRRKYTLDNSSRYSSSLTVNGDPGRIYDGSPQDTTASIMGNLTPKPPARRFGQVSPKPTDKIPALDFDEKCPKENEGVTLREKPLERTTPVPPLRRFGTRSSQRANQSNLDADEDMNRSGDVTLCDENENVPEDYVFKRFNQDAIRKSNLSINSCVSIGSTASAYGRKKRRAPQPPRRLEPLATAEENVTQNASEVTNVQLQIVEPIDIAKVTENIDEMTKKSREVDKTSSSKPETRESSSENSEKFEEETVIKNSLYKDAENIDNDIQITKDISRQDNCDIHVVETEEIQSSKLKEGKENENEMEQGNSGESMTKQNDQVQVEYHRTSQDNLQIIKDVDENEVCLRKKCSLSSLSRSDSFSVKEEIEKIEKQIKALETQNALKVSSDETTLEESTACTRQSLEANRRHFFQNMVDAEGGKDAIKIEFKELPREQKNIHVVRLTDPPVPVPRDTVKVIELHISEPIKQKPEILDDVNPIPKPRRHSALSLNGSQTSIVPREERKNLETTRGKSF